MTHTARSTGLALLLGAALAGSRPAVAIDPPRPAGPNVRPTIPLPVKECRDPSAESLTFAVLSHSGANRSRGEIRLTGVVKNIGNASFESNPNQARAQLTKVPSAGLPTTLSAKDIAILRAGESIRLGATVGWDTAQEFPPKFVLSLTYDPDIRSDANFRNDDCNSNNNSRELTAAEINRQWR